MTTRWNVNLEDWVSKNADYHEAMLEGSKTLKREWLQIFARNAHREIRNALISNVQGNRTGTLVDSFSVQYELDGDKPQISLVMIPQGVNADRLPIYWKTQEFGSRVNKRIPFEAIKTWAEMKFPGIDEDKIKRIFGRVRSVSHPARPAIRRLFVVDRTTGTPTRLTKHGQSQSEFAWYQALENLESRATETMQRRGRTVTFGRNVLGQFASPG